MTTLVQALQLRYVVGSDPKRKVTWLELFFDLIFVAAIAQVGEPLREDYSIAGVIRFAMLFALIWWAWIGNTVFATRFDTDDAPQRALTFVQMFAVAAMAANASGALDSRDSAGFAAAYATVRFVLVAHYARARQIERARGLATRHLAGHGLAAALWLASALVPAPARFAIWATALIIDLGTPWMAVSHSARVPPDPAHLPERFGLFTLILLGESVVAVMHGMKSQEGWGVAPAVTALFGMAIACAFWSWYFDREAAVAERHVQSRRDSIRFHVWSYAHLPLYLGIAVAAAGVERMIHAAAHPDPHGGSGALLGVAVAGAMLAMLVISSVNPHHQVSTRQATLQVALAALVIIAGIAEPLLTPAGLVVIIAASCAAQLVIARTWAVDAPPLAGTAMPVG